MGKKVDWGIVLIMIFMTIWIAAIIMGFMAMHQKKVDLSTNPDASGSLRIFSVGGAAGSANTYCIDGF